MNNILTILVALGIFEVLKTGGWWLYFKYVTYRYRCGIKSILSELAEEFEKEYPGVKDDKQQLH